MSRWFGRGKGRQAEDGGGDGSRSPGDEAGEGSGAPAGDDGESTVGPYDVTDQYSQVRRIDLGALRIPAVDDTSLQVEVDKVTNVARSAAVVSGPSRVTLTVFAAPRSAGVWDEVRTDIAAAVRKVGGTARELDGVFGAEVLTTVPTTLPDGRQAMRVQRHVGVDGPRWFLRAVFAGPEVVALAGITTAVESLDPARTHALESVVRDCVVVRGTQARPPREQLPLTLPVAATPAVEPPAPAAVETA